MLEQVRGVMRLRHYSIHTERSDMDWIKRYVQFHRMQSRADLADEEGKIEAFLTELAVKGNVSAATQNQGGQRAHVQAKCRVPENAERGPKIP